MNLYTYITSETITTIKVNKYSHLLQKVPPCPFFVLVLVVKIKLT